jgi:hypothetical protein
MKGMGMREIVAEVGVVGKRAAVGERQRHRSSREVVVEPQFALIAVPSAIYHREERDREQSKLHRRRTHQWQAEAGLGALAQVLQGVHQSLSC